MANPIANESVKLFWVPAIADISAPTTAEMGDAIDVTCTLETAPDFTISPSEVDNPSLCSMFVGKEFGTNSVDSTAAVFKWDDDPASDFQTAVRPTLTPKTRGFWVRVDAVSGVIPTETTSGTKVDVAPVVIGYPSKNQPAVGERKLYNVPMLATAEPKEMVAVV